MSEPSKELAPLGRRRLDFRLLSPGEFELLCFYVVAIEFPEVVRVADPDGGADTALPRPDRTWERCWQAKRFTGNVSWPQSKDSLDAAVAHYEMPHYTFCFARDLTVGQEKLFKKHLVGRHPGVKVDHLTASKLELLLFSSDQGKRIAAQFWGDPEQDTRALARAFRAQGELRTGAQVLDRLSAVAEHLRERDPFYTYVTVTTEAGGPRPGLTPRTALAVETVDAGSTIRVDAVPRPSTQPEQLPGGTVHMTPSQAKQFEDFLGRGGDLTLEGVRFDFHNLPRAFEGLDHGEQGTVVLSSRSLPAPWDAKFSLETPGIDAEPIFFHLEPSQEVPADWDAALVGKSGTLTVTLLLRKREGHGHLEVQWSFKDNLRVATKIRAAHLEFVAGLNRSGTLVIEDVSGVRPRLKIKTADRELDVEFHALRMFTADLYTIEEWSGRQLTATERVPAKEAYAIHEAAEIIRTGKSIMDFSQLGLTMPREKAEEQFKGEDHEILVEVGFGLAVLGTEIPIGRLRGVLGKTTISLADSDTPGAVDVTIEPASEDAAHPTFELVRPE